MRSTHSPDPKKRSALARTGWSPEETLSLCGLYAQMLGLQEQGLLGPKKSAGQVSKAQLVNGFAAERGRTKGSVEAKLMNISAARQDLGLPLVIGYKPLANMGADVREAVTTLWG